MNRLAERLTILAPLRHSQYRTLFAGQVVSNVGDWLDILALISLLLYQWDLGPGAWGGVLTALTLPYALLGPFAGVWIDRWNQRTVMVVCDLARAALALGLVWAPDLATVLVLVTASSIFSTFHLPAQQAMIRHTVPDEDLMAANSLGQLSDNGARLLGPALGGLAVVLGGPRVAFALDALTFVASALILARLSTQRPTERSSTHAPRRFSDDLRAGLRHILADSIIAITVGTMAVASFLIRSTDTLGVLVLKVLGVGEGMQGLSNTALGLGYVLGALAIGQWGQRLPVLTVFGGGTALVGAMLGAIGVAAAFELSGAGVIVGAAFVGRAILGVGFAVMIVAYGYVLQRQTPGDMIGRVTATSRSLVTGIPMAAPLLATTLAGWLGLGVSYSMFGMVLIALGIVVVVLQQRLS